MHVENRGDGYVLSDDHYWEKSAAIKKENKANTPKTAECLKKRDVGGSWRGVGDTKY